MCKRRKGTRKEPAMEEVLKVIEKADDFQNEQILDAIRRRYATLYPDWEIIFASLHRDPVERKHDVAFIVKMLQKSVEGPCELQESQK